MPNRIEGLDARGGKIFISCAAANGPGYLAVLDGATGAVQKLIDIEQPGFIRAVSDDVVYVVRNQQDVVAVNPQSGAVKPVVTGLDGATGVTADAEGRL